MKILTLLVVILSGVLSSACMTCTVIDNASNPRKSDNAPWANYLLLPITIPADIATSPIQLAAFLSYARGERPHGPVVRNTETEASTTNAPVAPKPLLSPKERADHD